MEQHCRRCRSQAPESSKGASGKSYEEQQTYLTGKCMASFSSRKYQVTVLGVAGRGWGEGERGARRVVLVSWNSSIEGCSTTTATINIYQCPGEKKRGKLYVDNQQDKEHSHLEKANASRAKWLALRRKVFTYVLKKEIDTYTYKKKKQTNKNKKNCFNQSEALPRRIWASPNVLCFLRLNFFDILFVLFQVRSPLSTLKSTLLPNGYLQLFWLDTCCSQMFFFLIFLLPFSGKFNFPRMHINY